MRGRLNARDDSGASLILALILVTVVGMVLATVLSFADTSLRTTVNLRDQATTQYAADGAVQAAINNLRNSAYHAAPGQQCFGTGDTLTLPAFSGTTSAAVSCTADPSKVVIQCPNPPNQCNRPGNAILTLGNTFGETGLSIKQPNTSTLKVHGSVFSSSSIVVSQGSLSSNTSVQAKGPCLGTITSVPAAQCYYAGTAPADPKYQKAASTVPAHQAVPACTRPNSVITFLPGYYDDAYALSDMMDGNSACKHSTWWFTPGTYYFDFHNATDPNKLVNTHDPAVPDLWTVNDGYLVAGTPIDSTGRVVSSPSVPATIPGACQSPIGSTSAVGVQFIFGGDSRLEVDAGRAEICGSYNAFKAPVAVYGLTSGTATATNLTGDNTLTPTKVDNAGAFTGATPLNLSDTDGKYASWPAGNANSNTTTLTVSGYQPPSAIPAGSILQSATLRVTHRHTKGTGNSTDDLAVSVTPSGGAPIGATIAGHASTSKSFPAPDAATLDTGGGPIAKAVYAGTFTGASVSVTATLGRNDTEDIDAIQLDLVYTPPSFRADSGCVNQTPYLGGGGDDWFSCAVLSSTGAPNNALYVQGTTYTPGGAIDLTLNNETAQVFRFGVISRALWITQTGSVTYSGAIIEVPDDSPGFVFAVYLTAYVCPDSDTCTTGGTPLLRAKVAFVDADPSAPVPGQRQVVILGWTALF